MNNTNKVLIGAFIILFIGFLVSYNDSMITGKYSKEITGMAVGDDLISSSTLDCRGFRSAVNCNSLKEDFPSLTVFSGESVFVTLAQEKPLQKVGVNIPYGWGKITVQFLDSSSSVLGSISEFTATGITYKDVTLSKNVKYVIFNVGRVGSASGSFANLNRLYILEGQLTLTCNDPDGVNYKVKSTTSGKLCGGIEGNFEDACFIGTGTAAQKVTSCSGNDCYIKEYFCNAADVGGCKKNEVVSVSEICDNCDDGECIGAVGVIPAKCTDYHGNKAGCIAQNTIPLSACEGKTQSACSEDCVWYGTISNVVIGCKPKTKCVWTGGKCCGDGMKWIEMQNKCSGTSDLCFSFWPSNKEEGKGAKYSAKEVCWNIGSMAYGFWVPVSTY